MKQPFKSEVPVGKALVCAGANATSIWGDPSRTIKKATEMLKTRLGSDLVLSRLYQTPAFPAGAGQDFVNAAFTFETDLSAHELLSELHQIESDAGRTREVRWGARTLDLDLIAMDQEIAPDAETWTKWANLTLDEQMRLAPEQLILPHPRVHERSFALVPLCDLAPDWHHPILGKSLTTFRDALSPEDLQSIKPLD